MSENLLKQLENCDLLSAVLEIKLNKNCTKEELDNVKNHTLKCMACLVLEHPKIWFAYSRVETGSLRKHKFCCIRKEINKNSDYNVKNWYFEREENVYFIEIAKKRRN